MGIFGMLCPAGQVFFIHSKHMNKIYPSTLILVFTRGKLLEHLRGGMESVILGMPISQQKIVHKD